jgi:hypothetical protein
LWTTRCDRTIRPKPTRERKVDASGELTSAGSEDFAQTFARETPTDPELTLILERWPALPEAVRAGIVAMVRAVRATLATEN